MTLTNVALSLIGIAILVLLPCGCVLTRSSHKQPPKPAAHQADAWRRRREARTLAHLHARIAIFEGLIADETNRDAGWQARDRASARPNYQVSVRRALARVRIGMRWRAILHNRRFGF